jgi:TRAP-type uncharacterized transport system substrate-binding protein
VLQKNYFLSAARDELTAVKELILENGILFTLILLFFLGGLYFVDPIAGKEIRIAAAGRDSGYSEIARDQFFFLKEKGIALSVKDTLSSIQSAQLLAESQDGVNAAYIQGGVLTPEVVDKMQSLGSVDFEPVWIFYRKGLPSKLEKLKDLARYRVGVGPSQSGTWIIANKLFLLSGIDIASNSNFKVDSHVNNLSELLAGKLDVVINVNPAIDPIVTKLLHEKDVELFELIHASAYDIQLPFMKVVTLPAASINIAEQIPSRNISLLATTTTLAVSNDMHPSLQAMLLMAAKESQRVSQSLFLSSENKFPAYIDPSIPISAAASNFYDYGPPQLMRYLPFGVAAFLDRIWVYILTLLAIFLPLTQLNLNLRGIRFRIRLQRVDREILLFEQELIVQDLSGERKLQLAKRLEGLLNQVARLNVPAGCEADYFGILGRLTNIRTRL